MSVSFVVGVGGGAAAPLAPPRRMGSTSQPPLSSPPLYSPTFPRFSFHLCPQTCPHPRSHLHHHHHHHTSISNRYRNTITSPSTSSAFAFFHHTAPTAATASYSTTRATFPSYSFTGHAAAQFQTRAAAAAAANDDQQHQEEEEDDDEVDQVDLEAEAEAETEEDGSPLPETWDALGLGQAMVDFSGIVDDAFLEKLELEKGTRKLVNHEERGRVLRAMDGCSYKAAAGGSLSNTLVALARLGTRHLGASPLNVAMTGSVGSDPLGSFYRSPSSSPLVLSG